MANVEFAVAGGSIARLRQDYAERHSRHTPGAHLLCGEPAAAHLSGHRPRRPTCNIQCIHVRTTDPGEDGRFVPDACPPPRLCSRSGGHRERLNRRPEDVFAGFPDAARYEPIAIPGSPNGARLRVPVACALTRWAQWRFCAPAQRRFRGRTCRRHRTHPAPQCRWRRHSRMRRRTLQRAVQGRGRPRAELRSYESADLANDELAVFRAALFSSRHYWSRRTRGTPHRRSGTRSGR